MSVELHDIFSPFKVKPFKYSIHLDLEPPYQTVITGRKDTLFVSLDPKIHYALMKNESLGDLI